MAALSISNTCPFYWIVERLNSKIAAFLSISSNDWNQIDKLKKIYDPFLYQKIQIFC